MASLLFDLVMARDIGNWRSARALICPLELRIPAKPGQRSG